MVVGREENGEGIERKRIVFEEPGIVSIMDMVVKRATDSVCSNTYKFTM